MAVDAGIKLGVEGESTFKSAMAAANAEIKAMQQGIKEAASGTDDFTKKQEALTKYIEANEQKLELLSKQYETAKDKLSDLAKAMQEAKESGNDEAITKATNAYNKQVVEVEKLEQQMSQCRTEINNSKTAMDEQTESVEKGTSKWADFASTVKEKAVEACKAIYDAAKEAVNASVDMAKETAEAGDHIDKMSQKIGVSAEAYQEWAYVCERSGTSVDIFQGSMKTLSQVISDAGKGSETAAEKLEAIGLSYDDIKDKSPDDQLKAVVSALQDMDAGADRTAAATDLLGRAATELGPILNMTAEETKALADEAHEYGMVMSDDAVKASAGFEDALTKMQGTIDGAKNTMMSEFLPGLTDIMDGFSDLVAGIDGGADKIKDGFSKITDAFKKVLPMLVDIVKDIIEAIAEIAPDIIKSLVSGIVDSLPALVKAAEEIIPSLVDAIIDALPDLLKAGLEIMISLGKAIIENLPKLLAEIPKIIAAIIEAFTGKDFGEIGQHIWDGVTKVFEGIGKFFSDVVAAVKKAFDGIGKWFSDTFGAAWDGIKKAWDGVGKWFADVWSKIKEVFSAVEKTLSKFFSDAWEAIKSAWSKVVDWFKDVWKGISDAFSQVGQWFSKTFSDAWNGIKSAWDGVTSFFSGVWESIKGVFANAWDAFCNIGKNIIEGIRNGIRNAWDSFIGWIKGLIDNSFIGGIMRLLGEHSPSKVMAKIGKYAVEGFAIGIEDGSQGVAAAWDAAMAGVGTLPYAAAGAVGGSVTSGNSAAAHGAAQPINLQIDGRTFARLTVPYIDQQQGFNWARQMALGVSS